MSEDPDTEAIPRPDPAQDPEPAAHPGQAASAFGPDPWTPPVPEAPRPHRSRRRTGLLLAAAAAGLLALGGLAGYGIGQAAAGAGPTDAGTAAGAVAGYGHHRGPDGARGDRARGPGDGAANDRSGDDGSGTGNPGAGLQTPGSGTAGSGTTRTST